MASDSGEILKSGMDRVTVQLQLIPTLLLHQTPENFPVCGEILKSGMDRVTVQQNIIPTRYLQAQHRKKYPFRGDFFKSGMDRFIVQPHIIPTRSRQTCSKQVCLWDLAQVICITFIIQVARAI